MKTNILAIAPYEGMKEVMESVAATRDDLAITVLIGDLSDGATLAGQIQDEGYDVIISRGGTARMIESIANVPVVEIVLSGYDMLRVIRLAKSYNGRFAIVGFPAITNSARLVCELVQDSANIFTINSQEEAIECLKNLSSAGYNLIAGDAVTARQSHALGLNSILITSGVESIEDAMNQAIKIHRTIQKRERENSLLRSLLEEGSEQVVAFASDGAILYKGMGQTRSAELEAYLLKHIPAVLKNGSVSIAHKQAGQMTCIQGKRIPLPTDDCAAFYLKPPLALPSNEDLWMDTRSAVVDYASSFNALYSENPAMCAQLDQAAVFSQSSVPILVKGEIATGKDTLVGAIHAKSPQRHNTLITIDARKGTPKRWDTLLNHPDSPLCQTHYGIYIKNAQAIPADIKQQLCAFIDSSQPHKRNRLYFSWQMDEQSDEYGDALFPYLLRHLNCLTLSVPALRERPEDIPSLSSIYINKFNLKFGKQVVGLDADAIALLQAFDWPHNFFQLQQLIGEAVMLTDTPRIAGDTVRTLLAKMQARIPADGAGLIDLSQPLEGITVDIIRLVLAQENNNHSKAALRLGISRGTLWRKLKSVDTWQPQSPAAANEE